MCLTDVHVQVVLLLICLRNFKLIFRDFPRSITIGKKNLYYMIIFRSLWFQKLIFTGIALTSVVSVSMPMHIFVLGTVGFGLEQSSLV